MPSKKTHPDSKVDCDWRQERGKKERVLKRKRVIKKTSVHLKRRDLLNIRI